jgi:opacity protein-like surface antigen
MKKIIVSFMVSFLIIFISTGIFAETSKNYAIVKLGIYNPMSDDLSNNNEDPGFNFGLGFNGATGYGRYFTKWLALEATLGYAETNESEGTKYGYLIVHQPEATIHIMPILVNLKFLFPISYPLGNISPFAEAGLGGYFSWVDVTGESGKNDFEPGFHIGTGADFDLTKLIFVGLDLRYIWSYADYNYHHEGGYDYNLNLNGLTATVDFGFRF